MARNFKLAVEEVENEADVVQEQPEEVTLFEEIPEGTPPIDSAEYIEEQVQLDDYGSSSNDALQACTSLEALYDVVLNSHDKGGLTTTSAALAMETIARIRSQVGFSENIQTSIGFESFDKAAGRRANTDLALEAIGETIANIWASVVRGMKYLKKHFKSFIDSWRLATNNYMKAVNSFHKRLTQASTEKTDKKFTVSAAVDAMTFKGKFDPLGSLQAAKKLIDKHPVVISAFNEVTSAVRKLQHVQELIKKGEVPEVPLLKRDTLPIKLKVQSGNDSYLTTYVSDEELPGGAKVTGTFASDTATAFDMLSTYHSCTVYAEFQKSDKDVSEDFLPKDDLSKVISGMEETVKSMNAAITAWGRSCDIFYDALEAAEKAGSGILATIVGGAVGGMVGATTGSVSNVGAGARAGANFANKITNKTYFNAIGALNAAAIYPVYGSIEALMSITNKTIDKTGQYVNQNLKALGV